MSHQKWRAARVLLLATVLAGCEDSIEPNHIERPVYEKRLKAETALTLTIGATDVIERVVPGLSDSPKLAALKDALNVLNGALSTREPSQFVAAVNQVRTAFDGYTAGREDAVVDPDIGAIRLLVEHAQYFTMSMPLDSVLAK
jgi:hypothetical protein